MRWRRLATRESPRTAARPIHSIFATIAQISDPGFRDQLLDLPLRQSQAQLRVHDLNPGFLFKQTVAVVFSSVWAFGFTYVMLAIINRFTPVRVDESSETVGLDQSLHGERAYEEMDLIAS